MKTLLRSTFVCSPSDRPDLLLRNYLDLVNSGLGFETPADIVVWEFIQRFVQTHNHVPDYSTLTTHFKHVRETTVLDRLEELRALPARDRGDFQIRLETKAEERRVRIISELIKEAAVITQTGLEVKEGKQTKSLKGPTDAIRYIMDRSHEIVTPTLGSRLDGEVTSDGEDYVREYERVEADPLAGVGQHTGLEQMDTVLQGARRHELWIHAAFTGGLKSTFALNWAYNQSVYYHHDSAFFSLEMPYDQCRRILYSIHSSHEKFKAIRHKFGLQSDPDVTVGLPYENMKCGTLDEWHPNAKKFLVEYVVPDFNDPKNHYGKIHVKVADPNKTDFTISDLRTQAEMLYTESPFATVFVDHVGLMSPRRWVPNTTERLNEIIRDLKKLSMSFRNGQGIAVVSLFQIGRQGWQDATKRKERHGVALYNLTHLAYANEAEKSGDTITASWVDDDLVKQNRVQFQCLKSRDSAKFETFLARVEWPCRRLLVCYDVPMVSDQTPDRQNDIDATADEILGD